MDVPDADEVCLALLSDDEEFMRSDFEELPLTARVARLQENNSAIREHLQTITTKMKELEKESKRKDDQIRKLNKRIQEIQRRKNTRQHTKLVWPQILRMWLNNGQTPINNGQTLINLKYPELKISSYKDIYKLSCLEGNMSPWAVHPDFHLASSSYWPDDKDMEADGRCLDGRWSLPLQVQATILFHYFCLPGPIHAISRLPNTEPDEADLSPRTRTGKFLHLRRFHIRFDKRSRRPNQLLAPLLVNKNWHFWGSHCFYGNNSFAFSSIGEFGRFAAGIGRTKVRLLRAVDLVWIGSRYLTYPPKNGQFFSRRTQPLTWLPQLNRLESLTIWVRESEWHRRRSHEVVKRQRNQRPWQRGQQPRQRDSGVMVGYMTRLTERQPNARSNRSLRCLQGIDYVYCLRGLRSIKVFDYSRMPMRVVIKDETFLDDLRNCVTREKEESDFLQSKLRNLPPLISGWRPTEEVWNCLEELQCHGAALDNGDEDDSDSDGEATYVDSSSSVSDDESDDGQGAEDETLATTPEGSSDSGSDDESDRPDNGVGRRNQLGSGSSKITPARGVISLR